MKNWWIYTIAAIVIIGFGLLINLELHQVSIEPEQIMHWEVLGIEVTNTLLTVLVVDILIILSLFGLWNMKLVPSGIQNAMEAIYEGLYNLTESVAGAENAKRFYIIPISIFIYVLVSNWYGLMPWVPALGVCEPNEAGHGEVEEHVETTFPVLCPEDTHLVPLFRSPSTDLNNTLMLALVTQIAAQVYGFAALGFGGYLSKYFVFDGITAAFKPDEHGNPRSIGSMFGQLAMGLIDFAVGMLELLGEFNKVIAYTFRLFGNIFAGEVMILVITVFVPLGATIFLFGFEIFVGFIQAFIFFILSVAFYMVTTTQHHSGEEAH